LPDETTVLSFYSQPLLYGIVLPAVIATAVLLLTWQPWHRDLPPERTAWGVGLALVAGYLVGHVGVDGRPPWPPREAVDWLWYLTFAAAALSLLDGWRRCPAWLRWLLRTALWLSAVWVLARPALRQGGGAVPALLVPAAVGLLFWAALAALARRLPGAALPLALLPTAAGSAVLLYRCHSAKLAQLAGVVAASLLPVLARSCVRPALTMATAPVVLLLPGLWLTARLYAYTTPPAASLALLAAAALAAGVGCLPGVRRLPAWQRNLLAAALAMLLAILAVVQVRRDDNADTFEGTAACHTPLALAVRARTTDIMGQARHHAFGKRWTCHPRKLCKIAIASWPGRSTRKRRATRNHPTPGSSSASPTVRSSSWRTIGTTWPGACARPSPTSARLSVWKWASITTPFRTSGGRADGTAAMAPSPRPATGPGDTHPDGRGPAGATQPVGGHRGGQRTRRL
jgi:hypothetical protein